MPTTRLRRLLIALASATALSCGNGSSGLDIGFETVNGSIVLADSGPCGGPGFGIPPTPPLSGAVLDGAGAKLADLQLGCSYNAGPTGGINYPMSLRAEQVFSGGTLFELVGSADPGPVGCTLGPQATRHCLGGLHSGISCESDGDCGPAESRTSCAPDPRCYATAPIELVADVIPSADLTTCVVGVVDADLSGGLDVATGDLEWTYAVTSRVFIGKCPTCVENACDSGENAGAQCVASSAARTSIDCPPRDADFYVSVPTTFHNTTGEVVTSSDESGRFCEGQTAPGAFGLPDARSIVQRGNPAGDLRDLEPHAFTTVGTSCVPLTRNSAANRLGGLPYPLSFSARATLQLEVPPPS